MNIIFMGTPDFAVPTLQMLLDENYTVQAVVTQPDRPKGRGKKLASPPVKLLANQYNIPVLQPEKIRDNEEFEKKIRQLAPDLIVVVAFGQILPKSILDIPKHGCVNVHGSLLPKYRGSAPIQWAILNGEQVTGVTIMYMDVGMDTGDMISKATMEIHRDETAGSLHDRMMVVGAKALKEVFPDILSGNCNREQQDDAMATYAPMLDKQIGLIDWNQTSQKIECLIRGLNPWPTAYTYYGTTLFKIWKAEIVEYSDSNVKPGQIFDIISDKGVLVKTQDNALLITEIQAQGGRRMAMSDYLRGNEIEIDSFLGVH